MTHPLGSSARAIASLFTLAHRHARRASHSVRRRPRPSSPSRRAPRSTRPPPCSRARTAPSSAARRSFSCSTRSTPPAWSATPTGCSTGPPTAAGRPSPPPARCRARRRPGSAWGSRPVIGYVPRTQGMADRRAPSRQFSEGIEYEGHRHRGTPPARVRRRDARLRGPRHRRHPHLHGPRAQGRATLDVVAPRSACPAPRLSPSGPVGLMGYSQGGAPRRPRSSWPPTYAPDLRVKGAVVGAVPADLARVATTLDGGLFSAFAFFALRGLAASYDVDLSPYLNDRRPRPARQVERMRLRPARPRLREVVDAQRQRPADVGR